MSNKIWQDFLAKHPRHPADPRDAGYYGKRALSKSYLSPLLTGGTEREFLHGWENGKEATAAMILGKAVDHLMTWDYDLSRKFAIAPNRQSNVGKAEYAELSKTHWLLNAEDYQRAQDIAMLAPRPWAKEGHTEPQLVLEWEYNGIPLKGCPDVYADGSIYDIKTTADCTPRKCWYTAKQYGYWYQLAMYVWGCRENGIQIDNTYLQFLGTKQPYLSHLVKIPAIALEPLIGEIKACLDGLIYAMLRDDWPGYADATWYDMETPPGSQLETFDFEELETPNF